MGDRKIGITVQPNVNIKLHKVVIFFINLQKVKNAVLLQ